MVKMVNCQMVKWCMVLLTTMLLSCSTPKPRLAGEQLLEQLTQYAASEQLLFGQQDATLYGHGWIGEAGRCDCKEVCGDYPAIIGFDLGHIETGDSVNLDGVSFGAISKAMEEHHARGGIITVSWHPRHMLTGGSSWEVTDEAMMDSLLYSEAGQAALDTALTRVGQFLAAQDAPILFRPWHEMNGTWFWWGATGCTPKQYIALYQHTHEVLNSIVGKDKLVWAFSPNLGVNDSIYMAYYPGDAYVDLLGYDCYHFVHETDSAFQAHLRDGLEVMRRVSEQTGKPIALTETGLESVQRPQWWTETLLPVLEDYPLAYVLVWRNAYDQPAHYYVPFAGDTSAEDFKAFYDSEKTVFLPKVKL